MSSTVRISDYYKLDGDQSVFEFVDVALDSDSPFFLDPRAFHLLRSDWGEQCVSLLQSFFSHVMDQIQSGADAKARELLASLGEPNETHLGLSAGKPAGSGMGSGLAEEMWKALSSSQAAASGLLEDLEDTVLFVENIGHDRISDITTNIVRGPLIEFTQDAARYYGIPLKKDVAVARTWNASLLRWDVTYAELPVLPSGPLLLVPKCVVRRRPAFDPGEYIDHHILPILQEEELQAGGSLVQLLKNGSIRVTKKDVAQKYGRSKKVARDVTTKHPDALQRYRLDSDRRREPPTHEALAAALEVDPPDWDGLLASVLDLPPGADSADAYHRAVQALLGALFYPSLVNPQREFRIHDGRKRIDITFTNEAPRGTFWWIHEKVVHAPYVFVECKNYGKELSNPELDQLAGRFSPHRGRLGILCHRGYGDKDVLLERCRDTVKDDRGWILVLDDDDLRALVDQRKASDEPWSYPILKDQVDNLIA